MLDECISVCGKVRKKDFLRDNSMKWNLCENWGYQTENVYHLFFECPCYDFERHTLFKCMADMGLHQPVTWNMLLCGKSNISHCENIVLFNFIHTYILQTKRFHWWYMCTYSQLSYAYHNYYSKFCIMLFFIIFFFFNFSFPIFSFFSSFPLYFSLHNMFLLIRCNLSSSLLN